jgi:hypothetical protein
VTSRTKSVRRFGFTRRPLPRGWDQLTGGDFLDKEGRVTFAAVMSGRPEPVWARDLLEIARAAFLADKRFLRRPTPDRWTRDIELLVQVREPEVWGEAPRRHLDALLGTLTGDRWQVTVHGGAGSEPELPLQREQPVRAVALLSGGLDSACHGASLARARPGESVLFVSCSDRIRATQRRVVTAIERINPTVVWGPLDQRPRRQDDQPLEQSSRTRGFLYAAAAVHAAAAHGIQRVDIPENGQLAVNPPLTAGRLGALSTRSVHPWTLHIYNQLIRSVGGDVELVNPLLHLTKGEVCERGRRAGLSAADLFGTVSCGRHSYLGNRNCGSCFPCLVRRSGLRAALGADASGYKYEQIDEPQGVDLRAVQQWLGQEFGERDLLADMPWPPGTSRSVLPVLERGRAELASMIEHLPRTVRSVLTPPPRLAGSEQLRPGEAVGGA